MNKRNLYIDFWRGLAALSIICIHTAFKSGASYTPQWFRSLTLLFDVPFFFFLAGWSSSYQEGNIIKASKGLGKFWLKWLFFVTVIATACFVSKFTPWQIEGVQNFRALINNYMFRISFPELYVIADSIWFVKWYFVVTLVNTSVLAAIKKSGRIEEYKKLYCIMLLLVFLWFDFGHEFLGWGDDSKYLLFYCFFWMLGNVFGEVQIKSLARLCGGLGGVAGGYLLSAYIKDISPMDIQTAKFPPTIMYLFASMIVIFLVLYMKKYIRKMNKWIVHIGQNAIFYYFAQGVGSSLVHVVAKRLDTDLWFGKWVIVFACNVIVTSLIAEILSLVYKQLEKRFNCWRAKRGEFV